MPNSTPHADAFARAVFCKGLQVGVDVRHHNRREVACST